MLTTADTEVATDTAPGLVFEDVKCIAGIFCIPIIKLDFQQRYKTVSHVDSALTVGQSMHTAAKFPLFWAGPLLVKLQIGFGASVGTSVPALGSGTTSTHTQSVFDDRLLAMQLPPAGWPASIREGTSSSDGNFLDGYWRLPQGYFNPDAGNQFYDVHSFDGTTDSVVRTVTVTPQSPMRTAALEDDDHHIAPTSELAVLGGLEGDLGFDVEYATLEVSATGAFTGVVGLAHDIRDAVSVSTTGFSPQPVTNLTITPTTYANANFNFNVHFHLHIDLVFGHINVDYDIINKNFPIADFESPWSEEHTVRLGTASTTVALMGQDPVQQPLFMSHVGSSPPFPSFPQTVNQCLTDPPVTNTVPATCGSTPASGDPQHVEACIYIPVNPQVDPCSNIPTYDANSDDATICNAMKLQYLCGPISKEQYFAGDFLLVHKLDLPAAPDGTFDNANDDLDRMSKMVRACETADAPSVPDAWFKAQFHIVPCDASATLLDPDAIVTQRPSDGVTAGSCSP